MRGPSILGIIVVLWLIVGAIAAGQRGYFSNDDTNCAEAGTILVTVAAGPLNYVGANPTVDCELPQPSE
ncbi:hypothetical protein V6U90_15235 [Micromonospora sp. CPCC 206060]|uniref:hypothetical protein n=1 Tax=Micromonospora sp. CPCC 206060 TaxID=3122406 RepID=UPI002FF0DC8D